MQRNPSTASTPASARTPRHSLVRICLASLIGLATCGAFAAPTVQLTALRTPFDRPIGLDEHEPSGRLIETRNFPNGTGGNLALLSLPVANSLPGFPATSPPSTAFSSLAGVQGEVNLLTVKAGHSFGAPVGTVFVADPTGTVRKVSADGSSVSTFAQLPGGAFGSGITNLAMDTTGKWDGRIVASTEIGGLFLLDAAGNVETVATGVGRLQGVNFIPNDPARWGRFAGCIMAGTEGGETLANVPTHFFCRAADGSITRETRRLGILVEDIDVITSGNFYAIDFGQGRLWGAQDGAFASLQGDLLLTQEVPLTGSGLFHVGFDIATDSFTVQELDLSFGTGGSTGRHSWEQIVFSRVDMFNVPAPNGVPEPASLALVLGALGMLGSAGRLRRAR